MSTITRRRRGCPRGRAEGSPRVRIPPVIGLLLLSTALAGPARAFHDGGVGICEVCHVLHGEGGEAPGGVSGLLRYASATDLCLACHATANGAVMGADPRNPPPELGGGNFAFLAAINLNDAADGAVHPIGGEHAGHSIVSLDLGLDPDPDYPVAPGGSYPSSALGCTSCHDPHGGATFRFLRGAGQTDAAGYTFLFDAPAGEGLPLSGGPESPTAHTAYRAGWSAWCANCHGFYHEEGTAGFGHPVDRVLSGEPRRSYNSYDGPDAPGEGDVNSAYLPEVPLEQAETTVDGTGGAAKDSRLTCLGCHRAHASSGPASTRWDPNVEFLDHDGRVSGSYALPNPYAHPDQKALCVKCHYRESTVHGQGAACMSCHRNLG